MLKLKRSGLDVYAWGVRGQKKIVIRLVPAPGGLYHVQIRDRKLCSDKRFTLIGDTRTALAQCNSGREVETMQAVYAICERLALVAA